MNKTVIVTGASSGIGFAVAEAYLQRGYNVVGNARTIERLKEASDKLGNPANFLLVPGDIALATTAKTLFERAVAAFGKVDILINNAGIHVVGGVIRADATEAARAELEANFFGPLALSNAFAPVLGRNGGGAIINILSALSWITIPGSGTYSISKAAAWALTNGLRADLHAQHTQVLAAHMGYMDTDMTGGVDAPKSAPADIARAIITALEAGEDEVLADDTARQVKQGFTIARSAYLGEPRAA